MIEMNNVTCRACGISDLEFLFDLGPQPLAGGFLQPEESAILHEKTYPLPIQICKKCGLVQTTYVIPSNILFENYFFSSSTIDYLVQHFSDYAKWIKEKLNPEFVVEFGCNDGILLDPLGKIGIRTCGVDISHNITALARKKGLNVITGYFDIETAYQIRNEYGAADVVTGSNAFPHNDHPEKILLAAGELLKDNGHICLEMMYAGSLLEKLQWDSMYHEHLSYFCLTTLEVLLNRFGFHAVYAEIVPMHAGSLRVIAAKNPKEVPSSSVELLLTQEKAAKLTDLESWRIFSATTKRQIHVVSEVVASLGKSKQIWGYGAAGRATMWVNACKMDYLKALVDESPLRAGRLMPGTHTPIVFPDALRRNPPDYILVTAWNYFDIIRRKEAWFDGIWILPAPDLRFI
ncbi:MAG: class I SAM-dependent methyltransferase [Chloroflexi bacterium]|nr:class I SAM-dependent methyltransferase [Chloroflexota bacterium]